MAVEDVSRIERVPWSELGPEWIRMWGGAKQPEHVEVTGQTGSGKSYFLCKALQQRAKEFDHRCILIATKPADETLEYLGWPVVDSFDDVKAYRQVIFWPQTEEIGEEREAHQERKIFDLLARLWVPRSDCVAAFDDIGYLEKLSRRVKKALLMYWREARGMGITAWAQKQRPIGVLRDQHSETRWKGVFPPADRADLRRFAELLGDHREWSPVLDDLDEREFVLHYSGKRADIAAPSFITWIDEELRPLPQQVEQRRAAPVPTYRRDRRR
jgi:hypothetical protein